LHTELAPEKSKAGPCIESREKYFLMTVDVDGWPSLLRFYNVAHDFSLADQQVKVEVGASRLLDLFEQHRVFATFFVTGEMAKRHPKMVKSIRQRGHEIACHGLLHLKDEYLATKSEQENRLRKATAIIEQVSGVRPSGFRAPCLRSNQDTFQALLENGYLYDSSIIPAFIPGYYGKLDLNFRPYWLKDSICGRRLVEIPVSVNPLLLVPLSAAWMRNLGEKWVKLGILLNFNMHNPVVLYVHPRDVLTLPGVKGVPWHLYRNVGLSTIRILDGILNYVKNLGASFITGSDMAASLQKCGQ